MTKQHRMAAYISAVQSIAMQKNTYWDPDDLVNISLLRQQYPNLKSIKFYLDECESPSTITLYDKPEPNERIGMEAYDDGPGEYVGEISLSFSMHWSGQITMFDGSHRWHKHLRIVGLTIGQSFPFPGAPFIPAQEEPWRRPLAPVSPSDHPDYPICMV